jgi:hypothetical protein
MSFEPGEQSRLSRRRLVRIMSAAGLGLLAAAGLKQAPSVGAAEDGPGTASHSPRQTCKPVVLVLRVGDPIDTGQNISNFNGAPVTVREDDGTVIFAGFVPANGRVVIGAVQSGEFYRVAIGTVLQGVPFFGGGVDFVEMSFNGSAGGTANLRFKVPCEHDDGGGLLQVTTIDLKPRPSSGEVGVQLLNSCGGSPLARTQVQLWTVKGNQPPGTLPHPSKKLGSGRTDANGRIRFRNIDPRQLCRLLYAEGGTSFEVTGLLAGSPRTTLGTPGVAQTYEIADGAICNVQPDPP